MTEPDRRRPKPQPAGPPNFEARDRKAEIAKRLRHVVAAAGGNKFVSTRSGISLSSLNRYLAAESEMPATVLAKLAEATGSEIGWLIAGVGAEGSMNAAGAFEELEARGFVRKGFSEMAEGASMNALGEAPTDAIDIPPSAQMPPDIPVMGVVAGARDGAIQFETAPIDFVRRPPGLRGVQGIYALYVEGESMAPKFEPGDLVIVHPKRPVAIGDYVVIQIREEEGGESKSFIKRLVRRGADRLTAEQTNPAATLQYKTETILFVHKVLSTKELLGV